MHIGKYKITSLVSGRFGLDGGAMFGIIPKPLWLRSTTADAANRIPLTTTNLLIEGNGKIILVDTGNGLKWDTRSVEMYAMEQPVSGLASVLSERGIRVEDVTDVILTHLHFDHAGGATVIKDGKLIPAFPNARYHVGETNFNWASQPSDRDKGSYIRDNFIPLAEHGVLLLHADDWQFDNDISVLPFNGHTFGQQAIKISDGLSVLLYVADVIPTSAHIPLPYIMGYDLQPLVTLAEKKAVLKQAAEEHFTIAFCHDPHIAAATVTFSEKGIIVKDRIVEL